MSCICDFTEFLISYFFLEKNPVIFQNILLWDGLNFTDVATKSDCDQLCIDNNCKVANYIGTTDLCFISTTGSQIRNINSNPDLALKGGKCDVCFKLIFNACKGDGPGGGFPLNWGFIK